MRKKGKSKKDDLYGEENDEDADSNFSKSVASGALDSEGEEKVKKISMFCKWTHYAVVKEAGRLFCEFHLTKREKSDWDIYWSDGPPPGCEKFIKNMMPWQRLNHFPGIYNLARKNMLGRHLMRM
mgnify:CR=1 FL=1